MCTQEPTDIAKGIVSLLKEIEARFLPTIHKYWPSPRAIAFNRNAKILHKWADEMVKRGKSNQESSKSLVSILCSSANESGMSDQQIHDECLTFLIAG